jgi:hypothetical protein
MDHANFWPFDEVMQIGLYLNLYPIPKCKRSAL